MAKQYIIRCPIHGSMDFSPREMTLIDGPFFQRLRQISQLGFASLVFPAATHTRFAHSLGTAHLAGRVFDQLELGLSHDLRGDYEEEQLVYARQLLRFAALLHDIGHPPFSHAAESVLPPLSALPVPPYFAPEIDRQATHEDYGYAVIYRLYQEGVFAEEEARDLIAVLSKRVTPSPRLNGRNGEALIFPLLCQLINGEIDVDRMDYLLRDAYTAGVPYGRFDLDRMIASMSVYRAETGYHLALREDDVATYENFLLARQHMFQQVYFHKTLGAFTHYLKCAFAGGEVALQISGDLDEFVGLTEAKVRQALAEAKDHKWAGKILRRERAKTVQRLQSEDPAHLEEVTWAKAVLDEVGIESFISTSSNRFSSQVKGQAADSTTLMVLVKHFGQIQARPLADCSGLLKACESKILITQLYVEAADYQGAVQAIQERLP
ncbi:MAG: HD domain-containing protein [bacterium]|nr:HD domain-containing protein [bacterium]